MNVTRSRRVKDGLVLKEVEDGCSSDGFDDVFHDSVVGFRGCKRNDLSAAVADEGEMVR